ncbi:MAG: helix-turn-helix domain-containing protein [Terriglobales bacterium]
MREAVRSGRKANFYITENSFIDHYAREVGPVGIAVYHVLERHMNCETRSTWIGTARMADLLNLSQRTIQRTLKTLEDLKLIRILRTEKMTTYVIVPVPPRAKQGTIPLFDQIPEAAFTEQFSAAEENLLDDATVMSPFATPPSQPATPASFATTTASQAATQRSRSGDTGDAAYKEEQNLVNKSLEQEGKSSLSFQKAAGKMIAMLGLPATDSNRRMIEAAIAAETSYTGQPADEAAELIARAALLDRGNGIPINKFYFEDAKWRQARGQNGRLSKAEQRKLDNLEINARVKQRFRDILGAT